MNEKPHDPTLLDTPHQSVPRGSISGGIAIAWIIVILGHVTMLAIAHWQLMPVPEAVTIVAAVVFHARGQPRTGKGILLGLASIAAVALLLVAACFGLVVSGAFR